MVDFSESFSIGISAAERAETNREEISGVFKDLNNQLSRSTNGRIVIKRVEFYENPNLLTMDWFKTGLKKYWAIAATNPYADSKNEELAKWDEDRGGYPCKIRFGEYDLHCEDKEALEERLSALLRDPIVGETLHKLMQLPDKKNEDEEAFKDDDA